MNQMATSPTQYHGSGRVRSGMLAFFNFVGGIGSAMENWRRQQQARMQFARVGAHTLRDAGISEAKRFLLVNRPFG